MFISKDLGIIAINSALWDSFSKNDILKIKTQLLEDLRNYYKNLGNIIEENQLVNFAKGYIYATKVVQKEPELIYDLIQKGVLMQANYGSILGQYGENAKMIVKKFLEKDMVHFLGSDVHRQKSIYKRIPQALEEISKIIGEEKLEKLTTTNPKLALENKKIDIEEPEEFSLTFKEKIMMHLKK